MFISKANLCRPWMTVARVQPVYGTIAPAEGTSR